MVSAGHRNYAVCLPLYLTDMRGLAESAPDVHTEFINGNFCVHRTTGTFNGIWVDLAHEQTYNRDGKTSLMKGTSQNPAAQEKYLKTAPFLNAVSQQIEEMLHTPGSVSSHHRESLNSSIVTEAKVNDIIYIVTNRMTDPFDLQHNEVINIASGIIASSQDILMASQDILMAKERGIAAMEEAEANGFDKIKATKVVTFATQKQINKHKNKPNTVYQHESMVTRALYFAQGANYESKLDAFSHEWAQYPTTLFEPDNRSPQGNSMRKETKSDYLAALCSLNSGHDAILKDSLASSQLQTVYVIDAMAFIQRFQTLGAKTFQQLSELYLQNNLHLKPTGCSVVHFVGDRYDIPDDVSLKCDERLRRNQSKFSHEYIPVDNIEIPDWNALLRNPLNKGHILHYLSSSWCQNNRLLPEGLHLFLGGTFNDRSRANVVTRGQCSVIDQLSCYAHEEADTRLMAHIHFTIAAFGCQRVFVHATETDVIMLCMYHFCRLPLSELWIEKKEQFLPVHTLIQTLCEHTQRSGLATSDCLLICYVLTGCDTVSYPYRRGKRNAAHCALKMVCCFPHLSEFGRENTGMIIRKVHIDEARDFFVTS